MLERLSGHRPSLPVPALVIRHRDPVLVATRLVAGHPLSWEWARSLSGAEVEIVAGHLGDFLGRLHALDAGTVLVGLAGVEPAPQATTEALRRRYPRLVDDGRAASVLRWCEWVDGVFGEPSPLPHVVLHGDLHGYNQVWDQASSALLAVLDFEGSGLGDPHFDLRYVPGYAPLPALMLAAVDAYERCSGRRLTMERVMAWHVLTHLGDALWRTEAGVALPGGGTAASYVDQLSGRFAAVHLS